MTFDKNGNVIFRTTKNKKESDVENTFVKKLNKALETKEVELKDGTIVSNMDAIIDNLIGKAIDGDKESIRLIKEFSK